MTGKFEVADISTIQMSAESGDAEAQWWLGECYWWGINGIPESDRNRAVIWLRKAADQEFAPAQYRFAMHLYEKGDRVESEKWLCKAAKGGNVDAQYALGRIYWDEKWRNKTCCTDGEQAVEAMKLMKKSAEQGHQGAQYWLGKIYWRRNRDRASAVEWLHKAAEQGHARAAMMEKKIVTGRIISRKRIGANAQFARGQYLWEELFSESAAMRYYRLAAKRGHMGAQVKLGDIYSGASEDNFLNAPTLNLRKAVKYYLMAAKQGDGYAQWCLACMYSLGEGITHNEDKAMKWLRDSAATGYVESLYQLGEKYLYGDGVPLDYVEASRWLHLAAEKGHRAAIEEIVRLYRSGNGVQRDLREAVRWSRIAAEQGSQWSQFEMGEAYWNGEGVARDTTEAVKWYRLSASQAMRLIKRYVDSHVPPVDADLALQYMGRVADRSICISPPLYALARAYGAGEGVDCNIAESINLYRTAAGLGHVEAQHALGVAYANGDGVPSSMADAKKWLHKAAEQGHEQAKQMLEAMKQLTERATLAKKSQEQENN